MAFLSSEQKDQGDPTYFYAKHFHLEELLKAALNPNIPLSLRVTLKNGQRYYIGETVEDNLP